MFLCDALRHCFRPSSCHPLCGRRSRARRGRPAGLEGKKVFFMYPLQPAQLYFYWNFLSELLKSRLLPSHREQAHPPFLPALKHPAPGFPSIFGKKLRSAFHPLAISSLFFQIRKTRQIGRLPMAVVSTQAGRVTWTPVKLPSLQQIVGAGPSVCLQPFHLLSQIDLHGLPAHHWSGNRRGTRAARTDTDSPRGVRPQTRLGIGIPMRCSQTRKPAPHNSHWYPLPFRPYILNLPHQPQLHPQPLDRCSSSKNSNA